MKTLLALLAVLSLTSMHAARAATVDPDADYDRMDGTGASGKTVNVIEWEGNLEIHVSPPGSLVGLGLKLDKRVKDKSVMVIAYRFDSDPGHAQIRRAILGIELREGFKTYRDKSAADYDKIVITNNTLGTGMELASFKLDPAPKQLYPDGHPALKDRKVASAPAESQTAEPEEETPVAAAKRKKEESAAARARMQEDGTITPFFARPNTEAHGRRRDQPQGE